MTHDPIALSCGADDNYARPMAVTLFSALSHLPRRRPVHVFIVDGGIREPQRERLARVVAASGAAATVHFVTPDLSPLRGLPTTSQLTAATYLRLLIPDVVPATFARAIYLDSDLLVRLNLTELWEQDMEGRPLMAVWDSTIPTVSAPGGLRNYTELGLAPDTRYFNGGLLLLDLARWREAGLAEKIIRHTRDHAAHIQWADQDGLNAVLAHEWTALPPQWNLLMHHVAVGVWASEDERRSAHALMPLLRGPCICHFCGQPKPWSVECRYAARFDWLRALWRSRWYTPAERAGWFARYHAEYYRSRVRRKLRLGPA